MYKIFINVGSFFVITLFFLLFGGCAAIFHATPPPELHAIGVYQGKRANKISSTNPNVDASAKLIPTKIKTHAISIAQKAKEQQTPQTRNCGDIIVTVSIENKPLVLAFSAYDKTLWNVKLSENVKIEKIILSGYHQQKVAGIPKGTLIEVYTYDSSPCEYCYQGPGHFYAYTSPPSSRLKEITGLDISSWQGRYQGEEFSIFPGIPKYTKK